MEIRPVHWVGALLVSTVLHLGAAYVIYTPATGDTATGGTAVTVELSSAAALVPPVSSPQDAGVAEPGYTLAATVSTVEAAEIPDSAETDAETETNPSSSQPRIEVIQATPPVDNEAGAVGFGGTIAARIQPGLADMDTTPNSKPVEVIEARAGPQPVSVPATVQPPIESVVVEDRSTLMQIDTFASGHTENPGERAGNPGEIADAKQNYYAELSTWLSRHKHYPRSARRKRQEGVVEVEFVIDGNGRLLEYRIVRSSGFRLLDDEAQALLERAAPMPSIPAELEKTRLSIIAPISFSLR
jgi:protein TonB